MSFLAKQSVFPPEMNSSSVQNIEMIHVGAPNGDDFRGELFPLSCPKAVGCHSERQFSFSNGDNGWGWGGVLCIVFYVCLLVLYLLYIISSSFQCYFGDLKV